MIDATAALAEISDAVWDRLQARKPYFALRVGRNVDALPHGTLAEAEADAQFARSTLSRLEAIDPTSLPAPDRDTLAYLRHHLAEQAGADESYWWSFPVAPYQLEMSGVGGSVELVFAPFHFHDATDAERYLSLVSDAVTAVRAIPGKLAAQAHRGWPLPAAALAGFQAAVAGTRAAMDAGLRVADRNIEPLAGDERRRLAERVDRLIDDELLPAFDSVATYLEGPGQATAVDGVGMSQYPGGEAAYRMLVDESATYHIDPAELHAVGLEHVEALTEQLAAVRAEAGFSDDEPAYHEMLRDDPRFYASSPDMVGDIYQRHLAAIEQVVDKWFAVVPQAAYGVQRLDPAHEAGMSYGYYEPPNVANPVGRYRYNGSGLDTRSQLNAAALIFHELVPGHHFHLARQAEDERLHPVRGQVAPLTLGAYTEGWAEYAASLGFEMGLLDDSFDRYGALVHQRFIAQRLVVDTGLNLLGWSLERARDYMSRMTMESPEQVRTETLRYSTDMPAQALGYRVGWSTFWKLRHRAEQALAGEFDVRDFHEVILGAGALPLSVVEANVDSWIAFTALGGQQ